ncbi:hypothetical protein CEXT_734681 [Caerostris extrusa]|uniref:Uncharacterized protein n=1 Tax=Caerostris extrusa TaxID=172846 RepID=A0AAV4U2P7_CAEEX|nr:hypothetical protein CEXT_734681 [Caerostris extrusa]
MSWKTPPPSMINRTQKTRTLGFDLWSGKGCFLEEAAGREIQGCSSSMRMNEGSLAEQTRRGTRNKHPSLISMEQQQPRILSPSCRLKKTTLSNPRNRIPVFASLLVLFIIDEGRIIKEDPLAKFPIFVRLPPFHALEALQKYK